MFLNDRFLRDYNACLQRHPIGNEWEIQSRGGGRSLFARRRLPVSFNKSGKGWDIIELLQQLGSWKKLVGKLVCFRLLSLMMIVLCSRTTTSRGLIHTCPPAFIAVCKPTQESITIKLVWMVKVIR